ncbi:MAG: hypothetical protein H6835_06730 [Planctomycetes bacterium]|nr:hypothetical protein [Planctomycetota bacterium]
MHVRRSVARPLSLCALLLGAPLAAQHGSDPDLQRQAIRVEAESQLGPAELASLDFLLANMPERDLVPELRGMLIENVQLAHRARAAVRWGAALSDALFHDDVLPYAQANEQREAWRPAMVERFLPLVKDCGTPGEAALLLNKTIFDQLNVHYSTGRRRADQAPSESIAQGKASCTGLSILLADACRACCVPARLVSVQWPHKQGNHTWVEVWDGAAWRFVGADEPDPKGLDRGWFVGDAAQCKDGDAAHRVWAVSFAKPADGGARFAAGWGRGVELWGVDVTQRYVDAADVGKNGTAEVVSNLSQEPAQDAVLTAQLERWFASDAERRATFEFDRNLDEELKTPVGDTRLRAVVWSAIRKHDKALLQQDHDAGIVKAGDKQSPFTVKQVGEMPAGGWPLVIAMHGGGNAPKRVNDQQWRHMQIYYKDHPETSGYLYCALRAPTDEWNGFYTDYFYPLLEKLIRQFVVCDGVNPDKVIAIGYSHGGYGAFALGPKLPDLFAAVHASASAPTDGESLALGLHSLKFSFMVGGLDTAYGRRERCEKFAAELEQLQKEHPGEYPTKFTLVEGNPHTGLPDRDLLQELAGLSRVGAPAVLRWQLTDPVVNHHYWLHVQKPTRGVRFECKRDGNRIELTRSGDGAADVGAELWLDAHMVNLKEPVQLVVDGKQQQVTPAPTLGTLVRTMYEVCDPERAASWVLPVK